MLRERVRLAESGKVGPIIVFPEGTTENGRGLMKFKKGPFSVERPFSVYCLYYESDFLPCYNLVHIGYTLFFLFSTWQQKLTYLKFRTPIDPQ